MVQRAPTPSPQNSRTGKNKPIGLKQMVLTCQCNKQILFFTQKKDLDEFNLIDSHFFFYKFLVLEPR